MTAGVELEKRSSMWPLHGDTNESHNEFYEVRESLKADARQRHRVVPTCWNGTLISQTLSTVIDSSIGITYLQRLLGLAKFPLTIG